jgi:lysozyme family protein
MIHEHLLFEEGLDHAMQWEGVETNDPDDKGGHTKFGIAKTYHPEVNINTLTFEQAKQIYWNDYWQRYFSEMNEILVLKLFDLCINPGVSVTIRMLQGVLNDRYNYKLKIDGVLGPITAAAANSVNNQQSLYSRFIYVMSKELEERSKKRKNSKYLDGWLNRLYDHPRGKLFP